MIKKLICYIWGHKTVFKHYDTNSPKKINGVTYIEFKYIKSSYCTRCGKEFK